jgi:hypothetical protein
MKPPGMQFVGFIQTILVIATENSPIVTAEKSPTPKI